PRASRPHATPPHPTQAASPRHTQDAQHHARAFASVPRAVAAAGDPPTDGSPVSRPSVPPDWPREHLAHWLELALARRCSAVADAARNPPSTFAHSLHGLARCVKRPILTRLAEKHFTRRRPSTPSPTSRTRCGPALTAGRPACAPMGDGRA